jgi:hypothetical protein
MRTWSDVTASSDVEASVGAGGVGSAAGWFGFVVGDCGWDVSVMTLTPLEQVAKDNRHPGRHPSWSPPQIHVAHMVLPLDLERDAVSLTHDALDDVNELLRRRHRITSGTDDHISCA